MYLYVYTSIHDRATKAPFPLSAQELAEPQRCWKGAEVKPTLERFLIALKSLAGIVKLLLGCLEKEPPYLSTMVTC